MELIYIYIDKYRNYEDVELPFSGRFKVKYNKITNEIHIEQNKEYVNIYPDYIHNVNAIVGRNSVGKTNLMDLIGMKIDDRVRNNIEYEIKYKNHNALGHKYPDDVEEEKWHSQYFMIYYLGQKDGENSFCFEGNNLEEFKDVIENDIISEGYFHSKRWFSFICEYKYISKKLFFLYDMNEHLGEYERKSNGRICGDYRTEGDKLAIVSFRNNFNSEIYNHNSFKPEDDYKITIPRRIARLQSNLWVKKVNMLMTFIKAQDFQLDNMYSDKEYILSIKYKNSIFTYDEEKPFDEIYSQVKDENSNKCKIIESFIDDFYRFQLNENKKIQLLSKLKSKTFIAKTYDEAVTQYVNIIDIMIEYIDDQQAAEFFKKEFLDFINILDNQYIEITNHSIEIEINKNTKLKDIQEVIDVLLDRDYKNCVFGEMFAIFSDFFEPTIKNLSDGEIYNLGMYASILEQINDKDFSRGKENFILLFDEPETNMHPELARRFIDDIINFLGRINDDRKFQIIISTHSPFILSDILGDNILLLEKDKGNCSVRKCNISTFSANIHDILSDSFFMNSTIGEFAKSQIDNIIKTLTSNQDIMPKNKIRYIVSQIGDPIIKNKLQQLFEDKYIKPKENPIERIYSDLESIKNNPQIMREVKQYIEQYIKNYNNEGDTDDRN